MPIMVQTLRAIVLVRHNSGESDRRLTVLSEERGLVDIVAKGARKGGSRLAGASEPLSVSILHLVSGRHQQFVTQAQPVTSFPGLRSDYDRLAAALGFAEVVASTTPHEQASEELFAFVVKAVRMIEVHEKPHVALVWALVRLLDIAGQRPRFDRCAETGAPVQESEPFFIVSAGGYVSQSAAVRYSGRIRTHAEVLVGLAKLAELELPPLSFKRVPESLALLSQIWTEHAHTQLPALAAVVRPLGSNGS